MSSYLPEWSENSYPERTFFYALVSTLFPQELDQIIKTARKNRALSEDKDKNELIKITPEIFKEINELLSHPSKWKAW